MLIKEKDRTPQTLQTTTLTHLCTSEPIYPAFSPAAVGELSSVHQKQALSCVLRNDPVFFTRMSLWQVTHLIPASFPLD